MVDYEARQTNTEWDQFCVGITATFKLHELGYTIQPRPALGKVDLAAVFFDREKLEQEHIFFGKKFFFLPFHQIGCHLVSFLFFIILCFLLFVGNFTDQDRFPCRGCQDGYFTEYLVRTRLWKYERLPINGMKSIVFHGPSLTWCLAAGNTWFDHPDVDKVRCYSPQTIHQIRALDLGQENAIFDWNYYDRHLHLCLRLSNYGYRQHRSSQARQAS